MIVLHNIEQSKAAEKKERANTKITTEGPFFFFFSFAAHTQHILLYTITQYIERKKNERKNVT